MKTRNTVILTVVLFLLTGSHAAAGNFTFGIKTGLTVCNMSQIPEEWETSTSYKAGLAAGAFMNYAMSDRFSLQPEILYVQKGVSGNLYDGFITVDAEVTVDYVEIPLLAIYKFRTGEKLRPFIYGGPAVSYNLAAELKVTAVIVSADLDFSSLTHTSDFSLLAGAGMEYPLGSGKLLLDARFMLGFTKVIMSGEFEINGSTQTIDEDDAENYGFAIMAGYAF